eukprot:jgi/Bigna1/84309/fgenesh1_pg.129_\
MTLFYTPSQVTKARVEEMKALNNRRSVFNDREEEDKIAELRHLVNKDFAALGNDIELLDQSAKNKPQLAQHKTTRSHTEAVVSGLKATIAQAAKDFAEILQKQNKRLQEESSRRSRFESSGSVGKLRMRRRAVDGFWTRKNQATHSEQMRLQQLQNELGTVYSRMANIVASQQEVEQTEMGHNELIKYFSAVSGNRSLILKIFGILIAITILFTYLQSSKQ